MTDTTLNEGKGRTLWGDVWDQYKTHKGALIGTGVFLFILFAVFLGPYIYDVNPQYLNIREKNQGPSMSHLLGTDQLGRDMLAQVLHGGRVSLAVGVIAMFISLLVGTLVGLLAGYFKKLDGPLMRLTDLSDRFDATCP